MSNFFQSLSKRKGFTLEKAGFTQLLLSAYQMERAIKNLPQIVNSRMNKWSQRAKSASRDVKWIRFFQTKSLTVSGLVCLT